MKGLHIHTTLLLLQVSYDELQKCVTENKEDFSEHMKTIQTLLRQGYEVLNFINTSILITIVCKLLFFTMY